MNLIQEDGKKAVFKPTEETNVGVDLEDDTITALVGTSIGEKQESTLFALPHKNKDLFVWKLYSMLGEGRCDHAGAH